MVHFGFDHGTIPEISRCLFLMTFDRKWARETFPKPGIVVSYKAANQLNKCLSLMCLRPGEVAATAGTSGVIYAVTDKLFADKQSRVNACCAREL
jgi:xylulokinase